MRPTDAELAELFAAVQALSASIVETRADMAKLMQATAQCLATAEQALAEIRAMNAEAERLN